jgi:hypothetical protein
LTPLRETIRPLLLAPLGATVVLVAFQAAAGELREWLPAFWIVLGLIYVYALAAGLLMVGPALVFVPEFRRPRVWTALMSGALVGCIAAVVVFSPAHFDLAVGVGYGSAGAASGLVYAVVANQQFR